MGNVSREWRHRWRDGTRATRRGSTVTVRRKPVLLSERHRRLPTEAPGGQSPNSPCIRRETTNDITIDLSLDTVPRKFRGKNIDTDKIEEISILKTAENAILLGDPGSGKTTTIKRLINKILLGDSLGQEDRWQYPIAIRLLALDGETSILPALAKAIGIQFEEFWESYEVENTDDDKMKGSGLAVGEGGFHITMLAETKEAPAPAVEDAAADESGTRIVRLRRLRVGSDDLVDVLAEALDSTGAIVFLDGLDEVLPNTRVRLEESISQIARKLQRSKIVISCRSGDFHRNWEGSGFSKYVP